MIYTLRFPPPAPLLNMNDGGAWWKTHAAKKEWRAAGQIHGRNAVNEHRIPPALPFSVLGFSFPVKSLNLRRDPHNFFPTVKAIIDGLVHAGIFVDDSSNHIATTEPTFHAAALDPAVTVTIQPENKP